MEFESEYYFCFSLKSLVAVSHSGRSRLCALVYNMQGVTCMNILRTFLDACLVEDHRTGSGFIFFFFFPEVPVVNDRLVPSQIRLGGFSEPRIRIHCFQSVVAFSVLQW